MTSANKKGALLFVSGIVLGGLVATNHWSSQEHIQKQTLGSVEAELAEAKDKLQATNLTLETLTTQLDQQRTDAEKLAEEIVVKNGEIESLKASISQQQNQARSSTVELEKTVETQSEAIAKLKKRVADTDYLYAERYRLTQEVNDLRERILKDSHKMELSHKACEEYKKGNSWNRVSQQDCDDFDEIKSKNDALMTEFDDVSADLDRIKRELSAFDAQQESERS